MEREKIKTDLKELLESVEKLASLFKRQALADSRFLRPEHTLNEMNNFATVMLNDFENLPTDILIHNLKQMETHFLWLFETYCERPDDKIKLN